jgi:hypothetical protein
MKFIQIKLTNKKIVFLFAAASVYSGGKRGISPHFSRTFQHLIVNGDNLGA